MSTKLATTRRPAAAYAAIQHHYKNANGHNCRRQELDEAFIDLLADLMLFADDDCYFQRCLSTATGHYYAEKAEQS